MSCNYFILFQIESFIILLLFYIGIIFRKNQKKHISIMGSAIILDLLLVFQIEFTRKAIKTATEFVQNSPLINLHLIIAISTVLLFFVQIYSGVKLKNLDRSKKRFHRIMGVILIILRTLTLVTSFFTVSKSC